MGVIFGNGRYYSGPPGRGIQSIVQNADTSITITLTDGSTWTSDPFEDGAARTITTITIDNQGRLVFTLADGRTITTSAINGLPAVSSSDAGKTLLVNGSGQWEVTEYSGLPSTTSADEGKSLYVDENGDVAFDYSYADAWVKYSSGDSSESVGPVKLIESTLPTVDSSQAGKFLMVGDDGEWTVGGLADGSGIQF